MRVASVGLEDRERYDAAVAASPLADVLQSWAWGDVKSPAGWRALRLLVTDDDGTARAACSVLRLRASRGVPPILYAPRGPVCDPADGDALGALLGEIRACAAGAFLFKCDPPVPSDAPAGLIGAGLREVTGGAFGGVQPRAVMVVDLEPGPDEVFARFKPKWRYNVRLAERRGVAVREGGRPDIHAFHDLYVDTARRDGFTPRARVYFERLWDVLDPQGMIRFFVAEFEDRAVAAILCTAIGSRVTYNYGASANEHRNVMPNHLLQWTAIRWAAENGYKTYDLRGVSPVRDGRPVEERLAGLNRFKEGFGARYVEYVGELDLPLRPAWYALWRAAGPAAIAVRRRLGRGTGAGE